MRRIAKSFSGQRRHDGRPNEISVTWDDGKTEPLEHIARHSPTGMEWGYGGSGPSDLALSLCVAVSRGRLASSAIYHQVLREIVSQIQDEVWELPASRVLDVIARAHERSAYYADCPALDPDHIP